MLLFPAAILTISDESDRDFMKHLYINHAARMFRVARALLTGPRFCVTQ